MPVPVPVRKIKTDGPRAPICPQSCAYPAPCPAHACPRSVQRAMPPHSPPESHDCGLRPVRTQRLRPWCAQCDTGARMCPCASPACVPVRAYVCNAPTRVCVQVHGGERVREVGLLPSRKQPKFRFGCSPTPYSGLPSGISARIAALSALQATMEASFWRAASANSPLVRTAARSARGQSKRSDAGTPTSLMRSTICGPFEGVAHPVRDRAISPASIGA